MTSAAPHQAPSFFVALAGLSQASEAPNPMLLYDTPMAPNPLRVSLFLAEKGIDVPRKLVHLLRMEQKREDYSAINPWQGVPALELDDGTVITETIAICRYFEEIQPEPSLFGRDARQRVAIEMWQRRMEWYLFYPVAQIFRHTHRAMAGMENPQIAEWGEVNKPRALNTLDLLDRQLMQSPFVAGPEFSVADITALVAIISMKPAKLPFPDHIVHVKRWQDAVMARPAIAATTAANKPERSAS
jgi:glutathione S-transferase